MGHIGMQRQVFESGCKRRTDYYHQYLKSDAWQRKRMWCSNGTIGGAFIAANAQQKYIIKSMLNIILGENLLNGWPLSARIAISPYINKNIGSL
jgi:hypothetical protein